MTVERLLAESVGFSESERQIITNTVRGMDSISHLVLDIGCNFLVCGAKNASVTLSDDGGVLRLVFADDGRGLAPDEAARVRELRFTSRSDRSFGLGLPLFAAMAEQTGGSFSIGPNGSRGLRVEGVFVKSSPLCPREGDIPSAVVALFAGAGDMRITFSHIRPDGEITLDTNDLRALDGANGQLGTLALAVAGEYLREKYKQNKVTK